MMEENGETGFGRFALSDCWESRRVSGERGRFAVDERDRVDKRERGEPVDINCGRERFPSRGRRVRVVMAMGGMCQEERIDQGVDKKDKKNGSRNESGMP